jgi:outer membrane protein OmpA-like peptidoglycan-associated protein
MKLRALALSALVIVAAALVVPSAGIAAETQPHWTIAPFAGMTMFSDQFGKDVMGNSNIKVDNNGNYGARIGHVWGSGFGLEAVGGWTSTKLKDGTANSSADMTFYHSSLDLIYEPKLGKLGGPFIAAGGGYMNNSTSSVSPSGSIVFQNSDKADELKQGMAEAALGWMFPLGEHMGLRLEARNMLWVPKNDIGSAKVNYQVYGGALEFLIGGKAKDADADGVPDKKDKCPATPAGAKVDATGCPMDTDGDGVFDGLDKCAGTPKGAKVDATGCPMDTDGDGVFDGLDKCEGTPKGAKVDATGCPMDADADGVFDGIDTCPDTPLGAKVDAKGCPMDTDGDGVFDGLDKCANTPAGAKVDKDGCPIEVMEKETELLDTGMIRLNNVNFATGKSELLPEDSATLDVVGQVMMKWPQLQIEIGGHTDNTGSAAINQKLSDARANAVLKYLLDKFPTLGPAQFTAKGYGLSKPLVPNTNTLNRAKNRRVEFTVLNKETLKKEVERRKLLQK